MQTYRWMTGVLAIAVLTGSVVASCQTGTESGSFTHTAQPDDLSVLAALPTTAPAPTDNPTTPEKVGLGRLLFFDPVLSGSKDVACATCHHPDFGYAEFLAVSIGVNGEGTGSSRHFRSPNDIPLVKRNAQTILNVAFNGLTNQQPADPKRAPMFWDLRASSLENQALEPIRAFEEMRGHAFGGAVAADSVVARLRRIPDYNQRFRKAFGGTGPITVQQIAKAIAAYERTLVATNSRFDQYMRGDRAALSESEQEGLQLFLKAGCANCHSGPMLSDFRLHTMGVADNETLPRTDAGPKSQYAFRTPSLRNLRYTAPYMHSGKLQTLQQVLEFYEDLSGGKIANRHVLPRRLDPLIKNMNVEFRDINPLIEFLNTLNDDTFDRTIPKRVPSGLRVGGRL